MTIMSNETQTEEAKRKEAQDAIDARAQAKVTRDHNASMAAESEAKVKAKAAAARAKLETQVRYAFFQTNSGASEADFQAIKKELLTALQMERVITEAQKRQPQHSIYNDF